MTYKEITAEILSMPNQDIENEYMIVYDVHATIKKQIANVEQAVKDGIKPNKCPMCKNRKYAAHRILTHMKLQKLI